MTKTVKKFNVVKKVENNKLLKMELGKPLHITIVSDFIAGVMKKKQAVFLDVIDLDNADGEVKRIICPVVLHRLLDESYPRGLFVNKSFKVIKGDKVDGAENQYSQIELYEIEA